MRHMIRNTLFLGVLLALSSCAKEEFATNKGVQNTSTNSALTSSLKLCTQSTLISPQVDILMLWDNSTSFNIVTPETRASMGNLISAVSERFDYHILSAPLISTGGSTLTNAQLVVKNTTGLTSDATGIIKDKTTAAQSLSFPLSSSGAEPGVDRAIQIIEQNRNNGIFRNNAYTMIIVISNEDDDSCESETGNGSCAEKTWQTRMQTKIDKLLCLRGNSNVANCSGVNSLNSTMMRFINISALTACKVNGKAMSQNYRYKMVANSLYSAAYTNGWPTSNDHLSPDVDGAFDSYNLCTTKFSSIFSGVESSIKQTLLRHKYDHWPVAGTNASIDEDSIRVVRTDGKILGNRSGESNPSDGYAYIGNQVNKNTRYEPNAGEPFTGKMIELFGDDRVVYPDCLTVTYSEEKLTYGYYYLPSRPVEASIEVKLNGAIVPKSASNGWDYMALQNISALDPDLKVVNLPAGTPSGFIIRFNGSYKVKNTNANNFEVYYISAATSN